MRDKTNFLLMSPFHSFILLMLMRDPTVVPALVWLQLHPLLPSLVEVVMMDEGLFSSDNLIYVLSHTRSSREQHWILVNNGGEEGLGQWR